MDRNTDWHVIGIHFDMQNFIIFYNDIQTKEIKESIKTGKGIVAFKSKGKMEFAFIGKSHDNKFSNMDIKELVIMSGSGQNETRSMAAYMGKKYL